MAISEKIQRRLRRHRRIRAKISGTAQVPRLCVFRSNRHIYCQLINDQEGKTILSASDHELKKSDILKGKKGKKSLTKTEIAYQVGKLIAKKAKEKNIERVVFDRGGFVYHGRVKALAEGAREGGLKF